MKGVWHFIKPQESFIHFNLFTVGRKAVEHGAMRELSSSGLRASSPMVFQFPLLSRGKWRELFHAAAANCSDSGESVYGRNFDLSTDALITFNFISSPPSSLVWLKKTFFPSSNINKKLAFFSCPIFMPFWENIVVMVNDRVVSLGLANTSWLAW